MLRFSPHVSKRVLVFVAVSGTLTASAAGAATFHRLAVSQTTGSGGATTFLQTTAGKSALQGEVASSARTSITLPFGVLGEYDAASQFGAGLLGVSTTGYGVGAETFANQPAILGYGSASSNSAAIEAAVPSTAIGTGFLADVENQNDAADFYASGGTGVYSETDPTSGDSSWGVYAQNSSSGQAALVGNNFSSTANTEIDDGDGLYASSNSGSGVFAQANYDPALAGEFSCDAYNSSSSASGLEGQVCAGLYVVQDGTDGGWPLLVYNSTSNNYPLYLTATGDLNISGTVVTGASAVSRNPGTDAMTYGAKQTEATVEDFGTAQLSSGGASVPLRADFRSTISASQPYMVFLTPHGDTNGLYVASMTPQGFVVRESHSGRSTFAFDYRIVARPAGNAVKRLPRAADLRLAQAPRTTGLRPSMTRTQRLLANRNAQGHRALHRRAMPPPLFQLSAYRSTISH